MSAIAVSSGGAGVASLGATTAALPLWMVINVFHSMITMPPRYSTPPSQRTT
jgi:hypothetical protein